MVRLVDVWRVPLRGTTGAEARAISHRALHAMLACRCGVAVTALRFRTGPQGKPALTGHEVRFNLTRRGDWALLAVTDTGAVGIDIEKIEPLPEKDAIAAMFHPAEQVHLAELPASNRLQGFYRLWTRKEAVVKALGTGLSIGLDTFCALEDHCTINGTTFRLRSLPTASGYTATLAHHTTSPPPRLRHIRQLAQRSPA